MIKQLTPQELRKAAVHLSANDKKLAAVIASAGKCSINPSPDYFQALITIIVSQQLSSKAADSIIAKFNLLFGKQPAPKDILALPDEKIREAGLSNAKTKSIKDLSLKILNNELKLKGIEHFSPAEITEKLVTVKGIGPWSVDMFLIFSLGLPDILPLGDLGIKKGMMKLYGLRKLPDEKKMREIARKNNWSPYCSVASWYLWRVVDGW